MNLTKADQVRINDNTFPPGCMEHFNGMTVSPDFKKDAEKQTTGATGLKLFNVPNGGGVYLEDDQYTLIS